MESQALQPNNPIELEDVSAAYSHGPLVVRGLTFAAARGQILSVLGSSGSGKSTLLRLIAGLLRPARGRVLVHGRDVSDLPPKSRDIGLVFQSLALFPTMSVEKNIAFGVRGSEANSGDSGSRVYELLEALDLLELASRKPQELSGGQAQRVALARALAPKPSILLLDEPFSHLDRPLTDDALALVLQIHRKYQLTTVLITHDRDQALSVADKVVVLGSDGTVQQIGTPAEAYGRPRSPEVAALTGPINLLPGLLVSSRSGQMMVRFNECLIETSWMGESLPNEHTRVSWAFRPESASVSVSGDPGPHSNVLEATVMHSVAVAGKTLLHCDVGGYNVVLQSQNGRFYTSGQRIAIDIDPAEVLAYPTKGDRE